MDNKDYQTQLDNIEERLNAGIEVLKDRIEAKAATKLWVVVSVALVVGALVGFTLGTFL